MSLLHAFLFGVFILILTYLLIKYNSGATSLLNAGGTQSVALTNALQGR